MTMESPIALVRAIRRWDLVALVINGVIGAGIFGLPGKVHALIGAYGLFAFIACAFAVTLIVLCFAELGSRYTETGGPFLYAREAFGPLVGFIVGWLLWLARLTAFASLANLLVDYLGYFWSGAGTQTGRIILISAVVVVFAVVNVMGVHAAAVVGNFFTIGKLIPLVLFVAIGLFAIKSQNFSFTIHPDVSSFSKAVLMLVFAFSGFEVPVITAGETRDPRKQVPFALLTAMAVVVVLYVLIQLVCVGTLPELASSSRPLADSARVFAGSVGASVVVIGALISITGTLNSIMIATPRLLYAMAEQRQLPRAFMATHARFRTPHISILVCAAIMLALTISGSFITALTISTITRLLAFGATCAAMIAIRRQHDAPAATFRVRGGVAVAAAALLLIAWLLTRTERSEILAVSIATAVGLAVHFGFRFTHPGTAARGFAVPAEEETL